MNNSRILRVSIVIPAHNEEHHLRACLEAIAEQTVRPFEVIVADNNSTDRTVAVAKSYPFVRVVHAKQQGIVFARDAGFNAVTGDIIGRIDSDIMLPHDWVEHVQSFYANPDNLTKAWSGAGYFYNVRPARLVSFAYGLLAFRLNKLLLGHYTLWGSNMAFPRAQWLDVRDDICDRVDIHEDLDLAIHLSQKKYDIVYDTTIKTHAELRRVHNDRHKLWDYLQWWPRTLRIHGKKAWVICWFFGAFLLYIATFMLLFVDKAAGGMKVERTNNVVPENAVRDRKRSRSGGAPRHSREIKLDI